MSTRTAVLNPRAGRGVVRTSVMRIEAKIPEWEEKETMTAKDRQSISRTLKRLQELNEVFKGYHYSIVELMDDTEVLAKEQEVLDDHKNKVEDLIEHLEDLLTTEPVRPYASTDHREDASGSMRNQKRIRYLKSTCSLDKAKATIRLLEPTPALDICLVEKMRSDIDMLTKKLSDIMEDILSLPEDNTASLNEATSMEDELGSLTLKFIKLTHDREKGLRKRLVLRCSSGVRLPKISIPTFDGKTLHVSWKSFWEQFDATIHIQYMSIKTLRFVLVQRSSRSTKRIVRMTFHGCVLLAYEGLQRSSRSTKRIVRTTFTRAYYWRINAYVAKYENVTWDCLIDMRVI